MAELSTRGAQRLAQWLHFCLREGWDRAHLDRLDALWREHHDRNGNLNPPHHQVHSEPKA